MRVLQRHGLFAVLIVLLAVIYFWWTYSDSIGILGNDGPTYLMMAQHYWPRGDHNPVYEYWAETSKYPPLYPLTLAFLGGGVDLAHAHVVTTAGFMVGLIVLYLWLQLAGLPRTPAALFTLVFAAIPGSWLTGLLIQSEYLYLLLSVGVLAVLAGYQRSAKFDWLVLSALLVVLATFTRTIGFTLLVPVLFAARREPWQRILSIAALALAPLLLWRLVHHAKSGYFDELASAYSGSRWQMLLGQISDELPALHNGFLTNLGANGNLRVLGDALGLACLLALVLRALRGAVDSLYCLANLAILILWPYPAEAPRFLWVLQPMLLAQPLLWAMATAPSRNRIPAAVTVAVFAATLSLAVPAMVHAGERYELAQQSQFPEASRFVHWYNYDAQTAERFVGMQIGTIAALSMLPSTVPEGDCVVATRADIVGYFGRRFSVYPPLPWASDADFITGMRHTGCHFVFAVIATDPAGHLTPFYPLRRIDGSYEPILSCPVADVQGGAACVLARLKL